MNVGLLKKLLEGIPDDSPVIVTYDGDYGINYREATICNQVEVICDVIKESPNGTKSWVEESIKGFKIS